MTWFQIAVKNSSSSSTVNRFVDAVTIWCVKPHVVNRRLCGSVSLWTEKLAACSLDGADIALRTLDADMSDCSQSIESLSEFIRGKIQNYGSMTENSVMSQCNDKNEHDLEVTLRLLIPKQTARNNKVLELIILDRLRASVIFAIVGILKLESTDSILESDKSLHSTHMYMIKYISEDHSISLNIWSNENAESVEGFAEKAPDSIMCGRQWLSDVLLTKLARWSEEPHLNTNILSLRLISIQQYSSMYERLKEKYGRYLVEIWTESTDPQKFVYEDIGIAAYLLVLWEEERQTKGLIKKQSFIDLGCGNGLLVYILSSEGHPGLGVDIRSRKIWDVLSSVANLKEQTVVPSDSTLFPDYDWLIGNHSDELTPWIPFIAARSHYGCRYFVLPCCAYDFTCKFADNTPGTSQYRAYLDFVRLVGETCGFCVGEDVLRIPSTKRVCFVGMERTYAIDDESSAEQRRQELLRRRCRIDGDSVTVAGSADGDERQNCWAANFTPRPAVERQKNAVTVDRSVKDLITCRVLDRLVTTAVDLVAIDDARTWNRGGSISLNEVGSMFDKEVLSQLKSECGGLQTVLKNCPDVFWVREGAVSLRDWTSSDYLVYRESRRKKLKNTSATSRLKTTLCFYDAHHPDGCPLSAEHCRFAHGTDDFNSELRNT